MSKRKIEESAAPVEATVDTPPTKKSRKEKDGKKSKDKKKTTDPTANDKDVPKVATADDNAEVVAKAEHKALKKAKKQAERDAEVSAETSGAETLSKEERKALKKAQKLTKQQSHNTEESQSISKAAKKAAKAARKAAKEADANGSSSAAGATKAQPAPARALGAADAEAFFKANEITIDDDPSITSAPLPPITDFSQLPITDDAERAPFRSFKSPTPIQAAAWPYLLAGRDVVGVAETGSGKTWAFGVPCIRFIKGLPASRSKGIKAVIVSPTRELALQIQEQLEKIAGPANLKVVCVYGGANKYEQQSLIKKANIVVATPGRLNDFLSDGSADLSNAQYVVLDEADRMLDKGFEEDVRKIISATSADRQTLMFTATWPPSVRELAATFTKTPVKIFIGDNATGELRANTRVKQVVEVIQPEDKNNRLIQLLLEHQSGKKKNDRILVFCLYKKEADRVFYFLQGKGFSVAGIHGDMSQDKRIASLDRFKRGESTVLVATDVAARGLDIPAVKVVLNVTFPLTAEDYVHRIGRTGRAGQDGLAITLFTEHDKSNSGSLVNVLRAANQPVPEALLKFGTTVKKKEHSAYGAFYKDVDMTKKATKITFD